MTVTAAYGIQIIGGKGDPREEPIVSPLARSGRVGVDHSDGMDAELVATN